MLRSHGLPHTSMNEHNAHYPCTCAVVHVGFPSLRAFGLKKDVCFLLTIFRQTEPWHGPAHVTHTHTQVFIHCLVQGKERTKNKLSGEGAQVFPNCGLGSTARLPIAGSRSAGARATAWAVSLAAIGRNARCGC